MERATMVSVCLDKIRMPHNRTLLYRCPQTAICRELERGTQVLERSPQVAILRSNAACVGGDIAMHPLHTQKNDRKYHREGTVE
jgi:hypothetical protein